MPTYRFSHELRNYVMLPLILILASSVVSASVNLTGLEIAEQTLPFIDSLRNENGSFNYRKACSEGTCNLSLEVYPQTGAWAALAYTGMYRATGDMFYIDKLIREMENLRQLCPPESPSTDCLYVGVQAARAYGVTHDESYLDYLDYVNPSMASNDNPMLGAIIARQLALRYKLRPNEDDKKHGPYLANLALRDAQQNLRNSTIITSFNGVDFRKGHCWILLAQMELYDIIKDTPELSGTYKWGRKLNIRELLGSTYGFFRAVNFSGQIDSGYPGLSKVPLTDLMPCMEALQMAYQAEGYSLMEAELESLGTYMLNLWWDSQYSSKYTADNAFTAQGCRRTQDTNTCYVASKVLSDNAYAVYVFSKMSDHNFTLAEGVPVTHYDKPAEDPTHPLYPAGARGQYSNYMLYGAIVLILIWGIIYLKGRKR